MPQISETAIADLVNNTEKHLGRLRTTDIVAKLRDYPGAMQILRRDVRKMEGGLGIKHTLINKTQGNAKVTGLYATDDVKARDVTTTFEAGWCHVTNGWTWDVREFAMNASAMTPTKIQNIIRLRQETGHLDTVELLEQLIWGQPPSAAAASTHMLGFGYWFPIPTSDVPSFQIGDHSVFGALGGLSALTTPNWKSWGSTYAAISKEDLIFKMREAMYRTRYRTPMNIQENVGPRATRIYTVLDNILEMETLAEKQNDSLGFDLDPAGNGRTMFRRTPLVEVEQWEQDENNPFFNKRPVLLLDWGTVNVYGLSGNWMRRSDARPAPNQHNVVRQWEDVSVNMVIENRRRNALFTLAAGE